MAKKGLKEIVCIIDKSGSMAAVKEEAIEGFNIFLREQQELPGEALVTLVLFDTQYKRLADGKPAIEVEPLNGKTYYPGGMTALLDAVGLTLDRVSRRIEGTPDSEKPERVMVAILTDGLENSSVEYSTEQIFEKIRHKQMVDKWEFVYLGANQDAIKEGASLGIKPDHTMDFDVTEEGVKESYLCLSEAIKSFRQNGIIDKNWRRREKIH